MMHNKTRMNKSGRGISLILALVIVGCVAEATVPPPPTATVMPLPTVTPEVSTSGVAGRLVSQRVASPPVIDGEVDAVWTTVVPLQLPLTLGLHGTEHAWDMELRALHTDEAVYFLAQWLGGPPDGEENTVFNKLSVHWSIGGSEAETQHLDCTVACHTAFADGQGHFVYANTETIPQGGSEPLPVAGGWHTDTWTMEWKRHLVNSNPYDLQFTDLDQAYPFFVKIFERVEGYPDPVSQRYLLVFQP